MGRVAYTIAALLLTLSTLTSCDKELEYDVPTRPPQLVLNSIFAADSMWHVEVSTSASPGQDARIKSLKDARITLREGKTPIKDLVLDSASVRQVASAAQTEQGQLYFFRSRKSVPQPGQRYFIEVSHPGYESVSSAGTLPVPGAIRMRTVRDPSLTALSLEGRRMRRYDFSILDNGSQETVYMIELIERDRNGDDPRRVDFFSSEDVFREHHQASAGARPLSSGYLYSSNRGVFFTNNTFRGKERYFSLHSDVKYGMGADQLVIRVTTLSMDLFEYLKSYHKQQEIQGNPFAEPVQVYSNVDDGYGIFAGYSVSEIQVR